MSTFLKAKRLEVFIIVVIIAVVGVIYAFTRTAKAPVTTSQQQASATQQANGQYVTYQGMDGRSALELLAVFHKVDTKQTSFGPMIVGIDGVEPDSSHYWAFYVNGKLADVGADQYVTDNGDKIEWKVESAE